MDGFLHMIASLTDFVWEFITCFLAVAVYHLIVRFAELGASPFRMFRSSRYYYLVFVHEKAVELLKKGKSNKEIRAELRSFRFPFQSNTPTTPKAIDDMSFVGRVLGNDDILDVYIIKYNFEFFDFRKLEASMSADSVENTAKSKVSALLIDDSPANVDKVTAALVKWHTEPFVPERLERKKISAGENEAYYYDSNHYRYRANAAEESNSRNNYALSRIASILTSFKAETVEFFERKGFPEIIGQNRWNHAKQEALDREQGITHSRGIRR